MATPLTAPPPPNQQTAARYKLDQILDLIHEETKRPHAQTKLATGAMLAKLEYLFNELEKTKKEME